MPITQQPPLASPPASAPAPEAAPVAPPSSGGIPVVACILAILLLIFADGSNRLTMIRGATGKRLSEVVPGTVPIAPGAQERQLVIPTSGIDGKMWIMHTEQMVREGTWRVRHTSIDNHPTGREIHWSSGLMWLLVLMSALMHAATGRPIADLVPEAAIFAPPVTLILALAVYGTLLYRRYGAKAAVGGALFFATCFPIFEFFRLGDCDHHGLVGWCGMISVFAAAAGGAGFVGSWNKKATGEDRQWISETSARRWFIGSGIAGAAGLWISAATQIPILAGTGLGAILAGLVVGRTHRAQLKPELWRLWGAAGCLASLAFYVLEYFPGHLGWRLEVNHPLYALAWLGGGDLLCRILRRCSGRNLLETTAQDRMVATGALLFLLLPAVVILWKPEATFWVADRFLLALHNQHIREFKPFFEAIKTSNQALTLIHGFSWPLLCLGSLVALFVRRSVPAAWQPALLLTTIPCLVMMALAIKQVRWMGIAHCLWVLLAALIFAMIIRGEILQRPPRWCRMFFAALALIPIGLHPIVATLTFASSGFNPGQIPKDILPNVIERDVIHRLVENRRDRLPSILSGPTSSTELAFYGGVHVMGTLYWENMQGLKTAARIFSASSEDDAKALLTEHGITHILLFSWDDFTKDYENLLELDSGASSSPHPPKTMFVNRLLEGSDFPQWIRPLYYPIPAELELPGEFVKLFEVVPDQTLPEWAFHMGMYRFDSANYDAAAEAFGRVLAVAPDHLEARYFRSLALIRAGKLDAVATDIVRIPTEPAAGLWMELAAAHERKGQTGEAIVALKKAQDAGAAGIPAGWQLARLLVSGPRPAPEQVVAARAMITATDRASRGAPTSDAELEARSAVAAAEGNSNDAVRYLSVLIERAQQRQDQAAIKRLSAVLSRIEAAPQP